VTLNARVAMTRRRGASSAAEAVAAGMTVAEFLANKFSILPGSAYLHWSYAHSAAGRALRNPLLHGFVVERLSFVSEL
jgi:hypothetical protein